MIAIVTLAVIFVFLGWLLFMPLIVDVDTSRSVYQVYQAGTLRFWWSDDLQSHLRILGVPVSMKNEKQHPVKKKVAKPIKDKRQPQIRNLVDLLNGLYKGICVKWFYLDLDTDDVVLNARMIPAFLFLTRGPVHLTTNFEGRVYASLRAEIKLYRIGWAFLLFFIKNKKYGNEF